jgi:hypothetical protein
MEDPNIGRKELMCRTRSEHLQWCKDRALEYVDLGDGNQAIASMVSDLGKHDETRGHIGIGLFVTLDPNNGDAVRRWIEGFN